MTLSRWSRRLLAGSMVGFVFLALLGGWSVSSHRSYEVRVRALVELQARADALSVAADAMLVEAFHEASWRAFKSEAEGLTSDLEPFAGGAGPGHDAIDAVRRLVHAVKEIVERETAATVAATVAVGPLGVPVAIARSMQRVAAVGTDLDATFDALLLDDLGGGVARAHTETIVFGVAALLFAALSVAALRVLQTRVGEPLGALAHVADRVSAGERGARVVVERRDEVGQLAHTMNAMLDALDESERALLEQGQALVREKESLAASQRIAHVATWSWTTEDDIVTLSDEAFTIVGRDPGGMGVPLSDLLTIAHHDDRERIVSELVEPLKHGRPAAAVCRVVRPDGSTRTLRINGEPQHSETGALRIIGTVQDVTNEYALRSEAEAQARLVAIAGRVARLGGWSVDVRTGARSWSEKVCEIHGEPPGTVPTPEQAVEYCAPEFRDRIRAAFDACAHNGTPYDEELQIVTAHGHRVWVRTTSAAVLDDTGTIVRVEGALQDIDARKRAELRASASERRLRQTLESLSDPFMLVDHDGTITFANAAATALAGIDRNALVGPDASDVIGVFVQSDESSAARRAFADKAPYLAEVRVPESERWLEVRIDPIDEGVAYQARDVTERRALLDRLRHNEHELRSSRDELAEALQSQRATFDALPAHVAVLDRRGIIAHVNAGWRHFGEANGLHDPRHGVGTDYLSIVDHAVGVDDTAATVAAGLRTVLGGEVERFDLEYPCHGPDTEAWFRLSARRVNGGTNDGTNGSGRVVVMHIDITERMLAERAIARVAHHDPLTRLLSRAGFAHDLQAMLGLRWQPHGVIATIDLTGFRSVNDAHGFDTGDAVLAAVATRLVEAVGEEGITARVGGDSFAVFFCADATEDAAACVRDLVERVFGTPIDAGDFALALDVSLGYTRLGTCVRSTEELLREAEVALYDGVNTIDGGISAYTPELDTASRLRANTTSELKEALTRGEFELHFQPLVELESGVLVAAEALIRWNHPERGRVPPGAFIEIAEQSGLIAPIGSWVLEEACRTITSWRRDGLPPVRIAVNVSVRQLVQGDFAAEVERVIERFEVAPSDLTLEITESVYGSESLHLRDQLHRLHALGVRLALDDFGTGFSSLQYLQSYRFHEVKIDQSFVRDMVRDTYSRNVVETILGIARAIGADAVAEGIETQRQRDVLQTLGCRIGQGYHFCRPVPEDEIRALLHRQATFPVRADAEAVPRASNRPPS